MVTALLKSAVQHTRDANNVSLAIAESVRAGGGGGVVCTSVPIWQLVSGTRVCSAQNSVLFYHAHAFRLCLYTVCNQGCQVEISVTVRHGSDAPPSHHTRLIFPL